MTNERLNELIHHIILDMREDKFTLSLTSAEEFARRLLQEVQKMQEPVAFAVINGDRIVQLSVTQDPFYPHSTPLYKALEITE